MQHNFQILLFIKLIEMIGGFVFDKLNEVRAAWDNDNLIIIANIEKGVLKHTFAIPSHIIRVVHLSSMIKYGGGPIITTLGYDLSKQLELPFLNTIYRSISSRYPIISRMLSQGNDRVSSKSDFSISIDHVDVEFGQTNFGRQQTIETLGILIDNYLHMDLNKQQFVEEFHKSFRIPGNTTLFRSSLGLLRQKISSVELGLGLCQIMKLPMSTTICDILDFKTGKFLSEKKVVDLAKKLGIIIIDQKTIFNLWRGIMKIPKKELLVTQDL